jgi:hypothetical protein
VPFLYETGEKSDLEKAMSVLNLNIEHDVIPWAILVAEKPGGRQEAIARLHKLVENTKDIGVLAGSLRVLYFLGDCDYAKERGQRRLESPQSWVPWDKARFEFLAGRLTAEQLHSKARGRIELCIADETIALKYLGEGHPSRAKRHFEECLRANAPWQAYQWSRAFLHRMERGWRPPWIEVKEQTESPSDQAEQ